MVIYPSLDPGRGTQQLLEYDLTKTNFLFKVFLHLCFLGSLGVYLLTEPLIFQGTKHSVRFRR